MEVRQHGKSSGFVPVGVFILDSKAPLDRQTVFYNQLYIVGYEI